VLLVADVGAAERTRPFLIGALNTSWGPTPQVVGLRDGLLALGYRENEDFVIGVRFTQGDPTALPAVAQNSCETEWASFPLSMAREIDGVLVPRCCALNISDCVLDATARRVEPYGRVSIFNHAFSEDSYDIRSHCSPTSLVGVSRHMPVAADLSRCRAHRALWVVNDCGTRETGVRCAP
jgi:hypothetical protein